MGKFKAFRDFMFDQGHSIPVLDFFSGDWEQGLKGTANHAASIANIASAYYGMPLNVGRPFDNDPNTAVMSGKKGGFDAIKDVASSVAGAYGGSGRSNAPIGETRLSGQILGLGDSASSTAPIYSNNPMPNPDQLPPIEPVPSPTGDSPVLQGGVKKGNFFKDLLKNRVDEFPKMALQNAMGQNPTSGLKSIGNALNKPQMMQVPNISMGSMGSGLAPAARPMAPTFEPVSGLLKRRRMY